MKPTFTLLTAVLLVPLATLQADELRFAKVFTDHCVLQREMFVPVWDWAKAGSQVTLKFADQKKTATAGADGKWLLRLDPMQAKWKLQE